jgi:hypothetical protein
MAEVGTYMVVPEVLYEARIFPNSISMSRNPDQTKISQYSLGAFQSRLNGTGDEKWLSLASEIRPITKIEAGDYGGKNLEPGYYFIGEALRRRGDIRCRRYLFKAIDSSPFRPRAYARLIQSIFLPKNPVGREAVSS